MKLSVMMITYNHEKFIAQALDSILMQEVDFGYEIVIGEDCSSDATRNILLAYRDKHPDKIRLLLPEKNLGMHRNFVQTYAACRGQYLALLEGDDYWTSPHKLRKQVAFLDAHPGSAICFHAAKAVDEATPGNSFLIRPCRENAFFTLEDLLRDNIIATCSVMFRGGLTKELPSWMFLLRQLDWPLHLLNAQHGSIGYLDEYMSVYRIHSGGVWNGESVSARIEHILTAYRAIDRHFAGRYHCIIGKRILKHSIDLARVSADLDDFARAREVLDSLDSEFTAQNEYRKEIRALRIRLNRPIRHKIDTVLKSLLRTCGFRS